MSRSKHADVVQGDGGTSQNGKVTVRAIRQEWHRAGAGAGAGVQGRVTQQEGAAG